MKEVIRRAKKYLISPICVFIHVLSATALFRFSYFVLKYDFVTDIKKTTSFILVICSLEWIFIGFLYSIIVKTKMKDIIILSIMSAALLILSDNLYISFFEIPTRLIDMYSFSGLYYIPVAGGDSLGELDMMAYIFYYIMLFNLGLFINKRIIKIESKN